MEQTWQMTRATVAGRIYIVYIYVYVHRKQFIHHEHPWISWIYSSDSLRISPTLDEWSQEHSCHHHLRWDTRASMSLPKSDVSTSFLGDQDELNGNNGTRTHSWQPGQNHQPQKYMRNGLIRLIYFTWGTWILRDSHNFPHKVFGSLDQVDQVELDISCPIPADSLSRIVDTKGTSGCSLICDASNRNWNPQLDGQPTFHGRKCYIRQIQSQWVKLTTSEAKSPWQSKSQIQTVWNPIPLGFPPWFLQLSLSSPNMPDILACHRAACRWGSSRHTAESRWSRTASYGSHGEWSPHLWQSFSGYNYNDGKATNVGGGWWGYPMLRATWAARKLFLNTSEVGTWFEDRRLNTFAKRQWKGGKS